MKGMRFKSLLVCAFILLISGAPIAVGDWNVGDDYKMHWPQLPDLNPTGMDVDMTLWAENLADDFLCTQTGLITDIHIWASFADDCLPPGGPDSLPFVLKIYSNMPFGPSEPFMCLWTRTFGPYQYAVENVHDGPEGWYDPETGSYQEANHSQAYQYNFYIEDDPFIQMEGTVYWLVVYNSYTPDCPIGWKTTSPELSWNNNAVSGNSCFGWAPLMYPQGHEYEGQSINLAFVITGEEEPALRLDFGDAPDHWYQTTFEYNGARHIIPYVRPGIYLGNGVDADPDGQPNATASGDDLDGNDDDDGVVFLDPLYQGNPVTVEVTASVDGFLDAWIDFNYDLFFGYGDQIFDAQPLDAGLNSLSFPVPDTATPNIYTFARFRFSTAGGLSPTGQALDGEVEDYSVRIEPEPIEPNEPNVPTLSGDFDFGDAPEGALAYPDSCIVGAFPTCKNIGPAGWIQHAVDGNDSGAYFGPGVDFESEGNAGQCPMFNPNNYDQDECFEDGDSGLLRPTAFTIQGDVGSEEVVPCLAWHKIAPLGMTCRTALWGLNVDIDVVNNSGAIRYVNVLMDFDRDGRWFNFIMCPDGMALEHVLVNFPVPAGYAGPLSGLNPPDFLIGPCSGYIWTRFSITEEPVSVPKSGWNGEGMFEDGETEDYLFLVQSAPAEEPNDCSWNEGDDHKMHWPQLPDVNSSSITILDLGEHYVMDDFLCCQTGPITDIHFWCAFAGGCLPPCGPESPTLELSIFSSDSAGQKGNNVWVGTRGGASQTKGNNVWVGTRGGASQAKGTDSWEWTYGGTNDVTIYQYNICIEDNPPIQQEGQVYWLAVREVNRPSDATYQLGWVTTSPDLSWNGSAVFESPDGGSTPLTYPQGHPYAGQGLDMAFVITGGALDFGDAPAPYPTTLEDNGACHMIVPGIYMGNGVDAEPDGQPEATAKGDDWDEDGDDEDGAFIRANLTPGQTAPVEVTVSVDGFLDAWVDFNGDGSWAEEGDQIFNAQPLSAGFNSLTFEVPTTATWGITAIGRFRFSTVGGLSFTGLAPNGEVEDGRRKIKDRPEPGK